MISVGHTNVKSCGGWAGSGWGVLSAWFSGTGRQKNGVGSVGARAARSRVLSHLGVEKEADVLALLQVVGQRDRLDLAVDDGLRVCGVWRVRACACVRRRGCGVRDRGGAAVVVGGARDRARPGCHSRAPMHPVARAGAREAVLKEAHTRKLNRAPGARHSGAGAPTETSLGGYWM